jgi:prevent-host-death family protein
MLQVPAGEFQRHIGRYQDVALAQPIAVTRNGRTCTVLISAEEYARLKREAAPPAGCHDIEKPATSNP